MSIRKLGRQSRKAAAAVNLDVIRTLIFKVPKHGMDTSVATPRPPIGQRFSFQLPREG